MRKISDKFFFQRSSAVAGLCASICATPIDVIKVRFKIPHKLFYFYFIFKFDQTRMMNQRNLKDNTNMDKIYKSSVDCLSKVI